MRIKITYKSPAHLKPRINNPRTHTKKQIQQIAASIKEFGFISPVLVDSADGIIAGHGRVEAAKLIGMSNVPAVCVDHLTPAQVRAYVIADNKLAENARWDRALLALELQELSVDLNFDVTVTGFETAEIDLLIQDLNQGTPDEADEVPEVDRSAPAVSRPGDLWRIGNHRLLCGDALNKDNYAKLLGSKKAQMVFTDPPYNVEIAGNVSGLGKATHREFAMASGEMNPDEFTKFLETAFISFAEFSSCHGRHQGRGYIQRQNRTGWRGQDRRVRARGPTRGDRAVCIGVRQGDGQGALAGHDATIGQRQAVRERQAGSDRDRLPQGDRQSLGIGQRQFRFHHRPVRDRETARMALEPWLVEAALAHLRQILSPADQRTIVKATRTPHKVRWPEWWSEHP